MSCLNYDILEEILLKSLDVPRKDVEKSFTNFMLAGKETFDVGLKYLQSCNKACFKESGLYLEKLIHPDGAFKSHFISFDFPLFKVPLISSMDDLEFNIWTNPENEIAKKFDFEKLLRGNYKSLSFNGCNPQLSEETKEMLKKNGNIQSFRSALNFDDLPMPFSTRILIMDSFNFQNLLKDKPPNHLSFHNVERLIVRGFFEASDFNPAKMRRFSSYIAQHFPKLEVLNLNISSDVKNPWNHDENIANLRSIDASIFQKIPLNVKGRIHFGLIYDFDFASFRKFARFAKDEPNMEVIDGGVLTGDMVSYHFEIHSGLYFDFSTCF